MMKYRNHRGEERISDYARRMVFSTGAMQYDNGSGWRDIDTSLASIGKNHWFMNKAPYSCYIPKRADMGMRFENSEHGFSWIPLCSPVSGVLTDKNVVVYNNAFGEGINLEISAGNNCFTKLIVIEKKQEHIPEYIDFFFKMPTDNLTALHNDMRELELGDLTWVRGIMKLLENTESCSYIWNASVHDSIGNRLSLRLGFEWISGDLYMRKRIPRWVLEQFAYPIKTDASSSFISGTGDGYIQASLSTWTLSHDASSGSVTSSSGNDIYVGSYANTSICRAFFPFDTTGLPQNAQATSATFSVVRDRAIYGTQRVRLTECFQSSTSSLSDSDYNDNGYDLGNESSGRAAYPPSVAGCDSDPRLAFPTFTLNSTGLAWIKSDTSTWTKLGLRNTNDCNKVQPGSDMLDVVVSSAHSDSTKHPTLAVVYETDYSEGAGSGGFGWGGYAIIGADAVFSGSGGFGAGGVASVLRPVAYDIGNVFALASNIKTVTSATASSTKTNYEISYATEQYRRPYLLWKSNTISDTTIEITWDEAIDTLLLYNVNFNSFKIEMANITEFETFQDINTGLYHGIVRINKTGTGTGTAYLPQSSVLRSAMGTDDERLYPAYVEVEVGESSGYSTDTNYIKIIIPGQTPNDGASEFQIGSIVGAVRIDMTEVPRYPFRKELVELVKRRDFEGGSFETEEYGNSHHLLEYSWDNISYANFQELEQVVREVDIVGACIIYEKWDDYESAYLCNLLGDFDYSVANRDRITASLSFREFN